ncbi:MAG: histidinol-phosphatase [Bacteroidetes bacterium]|nr:histidinol-phosphatase [Bacteroidota bacterium]
MKKKILFLDRDGTIIREPHDFQIDTLEKVSFLPYVITSLAQLVQAGYELVMVTNQDGLGTPVLPWEHFNPPQQFMLDILAGEGISFLEICIDEHYAHEDHPNRKPGTGMILPLLQKYDIDLGASYVVGDRKTDAKLAENFGCASLTIKDALSNDGDATLTDMPAPPTVHFTNWQDLARWVLAQK